MTPLQRLKSLDAPIIQLLSGFPAHDRALPSWQARQRFFGDLADYWNAPDSTGENRKARLIQLRGQQLRAEIELRMADQTLEPAHAQLLETCLDKPLSWQRQVLPAATRPQLYRPLLDITRPNWRGHIPGVVVIVEGGPPGQLLNHGQARGRALLCSLSHGIEAFSDLSALHRELCERLDDPLQSLPLLRLFVRTDDQSCAHNAERLRYDWLTDDLLQSQVQDLLDAQQRRLADCWQIHPEPAQTSAQEEFAARLRRAADLLEATTSRAVLPTRYALLLEKHSPAWLQRASPQALTHIMQTIQELVISIERAAAPGIPRHHEFLEQNSLQVWTRERLRQALRQQHLLDIDPRHVLISVTMARQVGPVLHPSLPNSYVPVASRDRVGGTVELVPRTYSLEQLALLNVAWLDVDYWLTARVHQADGSALPELSAAQAKKLVRELDTGASYPRFLRTHLIDSAAGRWRQQAHANINRARMHAEAAKGRYAGHFKYSPGQIGYRWARAIMNFPDSQWRPLVQENRIQVRQMLISNQTLQGVLLITTDTPTVKRFLLYAPDAPDRKPWREYASVRELLRSLRDKPAFRDYVIERLPMAKRSTLQTLLTKGRLGRELTTPEITGNFLHACYLAEVRAVIAAVDASTNTRLELLGHASLRALWVILDIVSLILPNRALTPLAFGRAAISALDSVQALDEDDRIGALAHLVEMFTHAGDGLNSISGSTVVRRAIRAMPPTPPVMLPPSYKVQPDPAKLRYRIDGIHGEGVFEKPSTYPGLTHYYIQDNTGFYYQVAFDGYRWRAVDPQQVDAYTKVAVKRREDGEWVVDSPVLWYDGLPDLAALLDDCRLEEVPQGEAEPSTPGVYRSNDKLHLRAGGHALPLRAHLLEHHYHLLIPGQPNRRGPAWAILRWQDEQWRIRVRQPGRSSDWLALPAGYSDNRGSSRSSR